MSTGEVTCDKPRTFKSLFPFYTEKETETPKNPAGIQDISMSSMTPLNYTETIFEDIKSSLIERGSIYHNKIQYTFELKPNEEGNMAIKFFLDGQPVNHADGLLQDSSSGEFFYFLAIDDAVEESKKTIDAELIDEATILDYNKEYRGIGLINLYRGNTGHLLAKKQKLLRVKSHPKNKFEQVKKAAPENIETLLEPVEAGTQIVRFVEVIGVLHPLGNQ